MPFWNDRNDARMPEELRDMSQDGLLEAVKFFKENKEKLPTVTTELEALRAREAAQAAALEEQKQALEALRASIQQAPPPDPPPPNPQKPVEFFENPDQAFQQRIAPRDQYMMDTRAQVAQMAFERDILMEPGKFGDDPKLYKKYRKEVIDLIKREPLVNQSNPTAWKNAFLLVKGLHGDDISEARQAKDVTFYGETPAPRGPVMEQTNEIIDSDRLAAQRYGITPEEVQKSRTKLRIVPMEKTI